MRGSFTRPARSTSAISSPSPGPTSSRGRRALAQLLEGWQVNGAAIVQSGAPWHIADTTTDFAGTGEYTGNSAGNEGGQWDFFGNPNDFMPNHDCTGVNPTAGGYTLCSLERQAQLRRFHSRNSFLPRRHRHRQHQRRMQPATKRLAAIGPLALRLRSTCCGCYGLGNSVLIPPRLRRLRNHAATASSTTTASATVDVSVSEDLQDQGTLQRAVPGRGIQPVQSSELRQSVRRSRAAAAAASIPSRAGTTTGLALVTNTPDQASSNPVLGSGGARDLQLGLKLIF